MEDVVAALREQVAALLGRVAELEAEVERLRKRGYKPQPNHKSQPKSKKQDRRTKRHRQHPGTFREPPKLAEIPPEQVQHHDVKLEQCPGCGSERLSATGEFADHVVTDIPEPQPEYHRYRRHEFECQDCGQKCQGRGDLELPGSQVGPRARLLRMRLPWPNGASNSRPRTTTRSATPSRNASAIWRPRPAPTPT